MSKSFSIRLRSIFHDPEVFHRPEVFDPQRWITTDEKGREIIRADLRDFTFGFGRRWVLLLISSFTGLF